MEYVQADYLAQFAGLESGDLHIAMEIWETTGREAMDAATATGNVVNLGPTGMQAKEEWWYPCLYGRTLPRPAQLGSVERPGLRRGVFHRRNRAQGPLSGWPSDMGRV